MPSSPPVQNFAEVFSRSDWTMVLLLASGIGVER